MNKSKLVFILYSTFLLSVVFLGITFIIYPGLTAANGVRNILAGIGLLVFIGCVVQWSMDCTEYVLSKKNQSETKTENENK